MISKEEKYKEEIFSILKHSIGEIDDSEIEILKEIFMSESEEIDNDSLIEKIIKRP